MKAPRVLHPLAGSGFCNFHHQFSKHKNYSSRSRRQRWVSAFVLPGRCLLSKLEGLRWQKRIKAHVLSAPPVFIIGHWGGGTTYLHYLLSRDPSFGFLDFGQALMPWNMFDTNQCLRRLIRPLIPQDRPFDSVAISLEEPQEEEMALANMNPISFFNTFYFPQEITEHTQAALFLDSVSEAERAAFEDAYHLLALRLSLRREGRRLLFKNPASTTRISMLRGLFPGAKFIHIVRNPFDVFASSMNRFPHLCAEFALQDFPDLDLHSYILDTYGKVMRRYLKDRTAVPPGDLFETSFENITNDPLGELGKIYEGLNLPDKDPALSAIAQYLKESTPYRRETRQLTQEQMVSVRDQWGFSFDFWNY